MAEPLENWQHHVKHTHANKAGKAWCGADVSPADWTFTDIDHAVYSVQQQSYAQPCPACVSAISRVLTGEDEGEAGDREC